MRNCLRLLAFALISTQLIAGPARACGDGEAPSACGGSGEAAAKWMLKRVVDAINADKTDALRKFVKGEAGFRTVDTYVFCVGPDGVMTAHPNPILQGQDVNDLHDEAGNHFIATMLKTAKPGQIAQIRYLFPRPGSDTPTSKTTYYTRAADQVCGVGVYEGDPPPAVTAPEVRLEQLRQRLTAKMPASLSADWTAFLATLDEDNNAKEAAVAKVLENVHAAEAVLASAHLQADH